MHDLDPELAVNVRVLPIQVMDHILSEFVKLGADDAAEPAYSPELLLLSVMIAGEVKRRARTSGLSVVEWQTHQRSKQD